MSSRYSRNWKTESREWGVADLVRYAVSGMECTLRRKRVQQLQREGVACFITYLEFLLIIKDGFELSVINLCLYRSGVIFGSRIWEGTWE